MIWIIFTLFLLCTIMNFSDVTATRHYVIRYPKSNRDTFRAQCYGGTKCSKGWYKANLANTWGLCKNEDKDNQRFTLESGTVDLPRDFPLPHRLYIVVNVSFNLCDTKRPETSLCDQRLTLEAQSRASRKAATIRESFQLSITNMQKGIFIRHSRFIQAPNIKSISLTFLSSYFCGHIREVFVYFDYCPTEIKNYAVFPNTSADSTSVGICVENSVPIINNNNNNNNINIPNAAVVAGELIRNCSATAVAKDYGSCQCVEGMTGYEFTRCQACAPGFVKPAIGNQPCQQCPRGSKANVNRTRCICEDGYQRFNVSDDGLQCFNPGPCKRSTVNAGSLGTYFFPNTTVVGERVTRQCQYGSTNETTPLRRKCVMTSMGEAKWNDLDLLNCRYAPCQREVILNRKYGIYTFPTTEVGDFVRYSCLYGPKTTKNNTDNRSHPVRKCRLSNETADNGTTKITVSKWSPLDLTSCQTYNEFMNDVDKAEITKESVKNVLEAFKSRNTIGSNKDSIDIFKTSQLLQKCLLVAETKEIFDIVLSIVDSFATNATITSPQSSSEMLTTLDLLAAALIKSPLNTTTTPITFSGTNMAFGLKTIPQNNTDGVSAVMISGETLSVNFISNADLVNDNLESFYLPQELFQSASQHLYTYLFKDSSMFVSNQDLHNNKNETIIVDGHVISITLYNKSVSGLLNPVKFTTRISDYAQGERTTCGFWKVKENPAQSYWSSEGCTKLKTFVVNGSNFITCQCDHLTSFGVLLNIYEESFIMADSFELSLASQIGCYISIGSLLITIVVLSFLRELRRKTANKILVNLSFSILGLLVCYLLGIEFVETNGICTTIGVFLHVFVLSTFMWMTVEAISLYRKAVRTFKNRGEGKIFFRTCFCLAWGGPILVALSSRFSGYFHIPQVHHRLHCMISGAIFKYALLVPVSMMLAINFILFIPIIRKVQGHITTRSSFKKIPNKARLRRRARVTISCTALLGLTWAFAYLSIDKASFVFQWVFAVINSMQGFFILLFHVFLNDGVIKAWRLYLSSAKSKSSERSTNSSTYRKDTSPIWLRTIKKAYFSHTNSSISDGS